MLAFQVQAINTGVYIFPCLRGDTESLSVSGNRRVTLHCADDVRSEPFAFDEVVFAPFFKNLYTFCLADSLRAQFGSAVQCPPPNARNAQRRATLVHGDPATHVSDSFFAVMMQASEEVERIAGATYEQSPYECVFSAVRVFSWGEEDVLAEAVRAQDGGAALSAAPPPSESSSSLWHTRTSVPLRTAAQRRLFRRTLEHLCRSPLSEGRDESAACVQQIRLAVYAPAGAATDAAVNAGERVLCAEHLFSMLRSVCDVSASFGTSMEALCETLVCRRQGNLLDNPLLPVLLPGTSVDRLTVVTCISAGGAYASRSCIDACCFGCSGERRKPRQPPPHSVPVPQRPAAAAAPPGAVVPGAVSPPRQRPRLPHAAAFQRMTGELLMSVAPSGGACPPADGMGSVNSHPAHTNPPPSPSSSASMAQLDESVDRILTQRSLGTSPMPNASLLRERTTPPTAAADSAAPPVAQLRHSARNIRDSPTSRPLEAIPSTRPTNADALAEAEARFDMAIKQATAQTEKAQRIEAAAAKDCRLALERTQRLYADYATREAEVEALCKELRASHVALEDKDRHLKLQVEERKRRLEQLERAAQHLEHLEPRVEGLQQRERELERTLELQERYVQYMDATCWLYTEALEAKTALMDSVHKGLRRRLSIAPLVERAAALQEKCDTYQSRVGALQREEAQLSRRLRDLESDAAERETALRRAEERLDTAERECAQHLEQAATTQATALEEYEESVALLLRLKAQREAVDAEVTYLAARRTELADDVAREEAQLAALRQAACRLESSAAAHGGGERCSEDGGGGDRADAVRIVTEELRKVLVELGAATEELAEVEDVMIEESDRAVAALRRCDGEMMIRNERLLDRVTAYMDVQSRLALRSASVYSDGSSRRASRVLQGDKPL